MDNKKLGLILIALCIVLGLLVYVFDSEINQQIENACSCTDADHEGGSCPHEMNTNWQTYAGVLVIAVILALALYLIFFDKSQKEIISTLGQQKQMKIEQEKFDILMMALGSEEQKVLKAVKEQDGITQQTLRLRTDLHKSKLSIVLDGLEKKNIISRKAKGKTKQVFLKIRL